ncbi:ABC transporter permease [Nakamurella aerolata]|uniref:Transport permease protein n=1 Tax=Nakamurella aerolata TaxID=1656892 RepID=A0A849A8F6_9ACTN|nr:ABC transporter permease [Nakamurella aerolata]NNG36287.1 ABC transporter permease [Nakamurella aerolata]
MTTTTNSPGAGDTTSGPRAPRLGVADSRSRSIELLGSLTMREIRGQYKRTTLGRLWSFINPLATIGIFTAVFSTIMKITPPVGTNSGIHAFALFLGAALLPWNFINNAVMGGMNALVGNAGLLQKVYFPRWIPVIATVLSLAVTLCFELLVLVLIVAIVGGPSVLLYLPGLIPLILLTTVFVSGIALTLSVLLVYFRDTQHFMALLMQVWFYLTPIVYPISLVAEQEQRLADGGHSVPLETLWKLNPAFRITDAFREVLYDFSWPSWGNLLGIALWAAASLLMGVLVFRTFSGRVVEEL